MAVYLIDRRYSELALEMAEKDKDAKVVLIQDGVYIDTSLFKEVFLVENDARKRGLSDFPESVKLIDYDELIDMMEAEKVYNFI